MKTLEFDLFAGVVVLIFLAALAWSFIGAAVMKRFRKKKPPE